MRLPARRRTGLLLAVSLSCAATAAPGEELIEEDSFDELRDFTLLDTRQAHLDVSPLHALLAPYDRLRAHLVERYGFEYVITFSPIWQAGTQDERRTTYDQKLEVVGHWHLLEHERFGAGSLLYRLESLVTLGNTTADFSEAAGSSYGLNDGDTSPDKNLNSIAVFAWEHLLFGDRLRLVAGKLDPNDFVALNRFVGDDREDFFATPLSANPVPPIFEANALGAFASYTVPFGHVSAMVIDAEGDKRGFDLSHLDRDNYHYAAELALTPVVPGLGPGEYRLTYYRSDDNTESSSSGHALSLSFDQDLGERYGASLKFAHAWRQQTAVETTLAAGLTWRQPLGFRDDQIGIGLVFSDASNEDPDNERDQYALEAYWRFQLTKRIEFTPDVQFIVNPARGGSDFRFVGGLRVRIIL
ncbi:MAG: carbohydrate porin [Deltaproteobacteria bacterium]|nr:MAG: carbohydrate porin [Deltaproteobacteria bacterium]